jgi:hypothetical protein
MTENALTSARDWIPCHCCGRHYLVANMVRFELHPDDAVCIGCVAWLSHRSRPIVRKLHPIWHLSARIRAWRTPSSIATGASRPLPPPPALYSVHARTGRCNRGEASPVLPLGRPMADEDRDERFELLVDMFVNGVARLARAG